MPYFERLKSSARPPGASSTRAKSASKTYRVTYFAAQKRTPARNARARQPLPSQRRHSSSENSGGKFFRNLLVLLAVISLFFIAKQFIATANAAQTTRQGFSLPNFKTQWATDRENGQEAPQTSHRIEEALERYFNDAVSQPSRGLEIVTRDNQGAVRNSERISDSGAVITEAEGTRGTSSPAPQRTEDANVYFGKYNERTGTMEIVAQKRTEIARDNVESAVRELMKGTTKAEERQNVMSCIPHKAKLLETYQQGETIYLNFNSEFESNPYGINGLKAQIYQVVYTATQYENVKRVIILINGAQNETLGGDGAVINRPFTRENIATLIPIE